MKDINKRELQPWDLFKFVEGVDQNWDIFETFKADGKLLFKGYTFQSNKAYGTNKLVDSKFEIIWNNKEWLDESSYDYVRRERMRRGEFFLDS